MALHDLEDIKSLVREDAWALATRTCSQNASSLGLLRADVAKMLLALMPQDHRKEYGPAASDYGEIQTDDYKLWYDDEQEVRCRSGLGNCFYIKLGVHSNDEGECCLVVSFHLDSRP